MAHLKYLPPCTWLRVGKCSMNLQIFLPHSYSVATGHIPPPSLLPQTGYEEFSCEDICQCYLQLPPGCVSVDNSVSDSLHHLLPEVWDCHHASPTCRTGRLQRSPATGGAVPGGLRQVKFRLLGGSPALAFSSLCWLNNLWLNSLWRIWPAVWNEDSCLCKEDISKNKSSFLPSSSPAFLPCRP